MVRYLIAVLFHEKAEKPSACRRRRTNTPGPEKERDVTAPIG